MTIEGTAVLEVATFCPPSGRLTVRLLDVHRIDAPSICVADTALQPAGRQPLKTIDFALEVERGLPASRRYQLSAHLDLNGDGAVKRGDLVTKEAYPWHPGHHGRALLHLRLVH